MNFHALMDEDELMSCEPRKPNASEFEQIVSSFIPKRFYSGVEYIIQFKQDPKFLRGNKAILNESCFYCKLCLSRLNKHYLLPHCASFIHLFRYFNQMYPIEYDRVINPNNLRDSIEYVIKLLEIVSKRQDDMDQVPELVFLDNLEKKFRESKKQVTENYSKRNRPVDLKNVKLNELKNMNLDDEDRVLEEQRKEILRNKSSTHNPAIQHLIDSNRDDFMSMPNGEERFANHKSCLRLRERGSMRSTNLFIKQEKDNSMEVEPQPGEHDYRQNDRNTEVQVYQNEANKTENEVEEVSDDYLRQLATKIMTTIETNNLNFDDEFIDSCTKYAELLIYNEYVSIENMEKLQSLFMEDDLAEPSTENNDNHDSQNFEESVQNIKLSPKIPEEPNEKVIEDFKQSPKIPEEPQLDVQNDDCDLELEPNQRFVDSSFIKTERY